MVDMKTPKYEFPISGRAGFPADIVFTDPKYAKLRRWVRSHFERYSESLVWRRTVKSFPEEFGVKNYGPATWNTKAMRDRIDDIVEWKECQAMLSDDHAVMPSHVHEHFSMRAAAYIAAKRRFKVHNRLTGSRTRGVSSHIALEETSSRSGHGKLLFEIWDDLRQKGLLKSSNAGEFWRYERFLVKAGNRKLRAEIWHDIRPWSPRSRLATYTETAMELIKKTRRNPKAT